MNTNSLTAGSPLWQTVFVSFAVAFVLLEVMRGWRLGLPRQVRARPERLTPLHESAGTREDEEQHAAGPTREGDTLAALLARLKNSVELGPVGEVVEKTDVLPAGSYQVIGEAGEVLARPETAQRFFSFPGARALSEHPKIVALQNDPEIARMIREGRFLDLLQNDRLIDTLNDPTLLERVKRFDFARALDYALEKN